MRATANSVGLKDSEAQAHLEYRKCKTVGQVGSNQWYIEVRPTIDGFQRFGLHMPWPVFNPILFGRVSVGSGRMNFFFFVPP